MRIVRNNEKGGGGIDRHFRDRLKKQEMAPPSDLWDKVEYRLDEERDRIKHDHWYQAVIMFLIPLTLINLFSTYELGNIDLNSYFNHQQHIITTLPGKKGVDPGNSKTNESRGFLLEKKKQKKSAEINSAEEEISIISEVPVPFFEKSEQTTAENQENQQVSALSPQDDTTLEISMAEAALLERIKLETSATSDDINFYHHRNSQSDELSLVKGFHFGVEGQFNNTWMLHKNNSLHPLVGNAIHRRFDWGSAYGLSAGYDFSNKLGMEVEWIIHSEQGQKYVENRYNKILIDGEIDLQYMHVPVMLKYKWVRLGKRSMSPRVINFVAGVQYSRLKNASVSQNHLDIENVNDLFNKNELGLILGLEYDLYLHKNCFVTLGSRASISTDAGAFPYFNSENSNTYNVLIGVNAAIHYAVKKKASHTNEKPHFK